MNYCALDDAFQTIGGAPSPGCAADYATKMARKEERRKARRCKGPAAAYLDIEDKDPDRPSTNMAPPVPAMNSESGLREHVPVTAPQGTTEAFTHGYASEIPDQRKPNFDQDPMYNYLKDEMTKHLIPVWAPTTETLKPSMRKKFLAQIRMAICLRIMNRMRRKHCIRIFERRLNKRGRHGRGPFRLLLWICIGSHLRQRGRKHHLWSIYLHLAESISALRRIRPWTK